MIATNFKTNSTKFQKADDVINSVFSNNNHVLSHIDVVVMKHQFITSNIEFICREICNTHFEYQIESYENNSSHKISIRPKEHCLVEGGMMYKSAGSIISKMIENGLMIKTMIPNLKKIVD